MALEVAAQVHNSFATRIRLDDAIDKEQMLRWEE